MRDPFVLEPEPAARKRLAARRAKWKAAWAHRARVTPEELAEEEMRLEAEKLAFLARRDGVQDAA